MTLDEFTTLVNAHDLTYEYSDDPGVYRAGSAALSRIAAASVHFPPEDVVRIWNTMVDKFLIPEAAPQFYMHPDQPMWWREARHVQTQVENLT